MKGIKMISLVQRLHHWLADEAVVYECQNYGTTLDDQPHTCPAYNAEDIGYHDLK